MTTKPALQKIPEDTLQTEVKEKHNHESTLKQKNTRTVAKQVRNWKTLSTTKSEELTHTFQ